MITIDLKYTLVCLVLIALFVLLIMLAVLVKNLVSTIKNLNKVVDDASTVSKVASDRASQVDGIVGDLGEVTTAMKGNRSLIGAVTNLAKAVSSMFAYFRDDNRNKDFLHRRNRKRKKHH